MNAAHITDSVLLWKVPYLNKLFIEKKVLLSKQFIAVYSLHCLFQLPRIMALLT